MEARNLLQGGAPVVGLAFHYAFKQEADYLGRIKLGGRSRGAVPHISIEIIPDAAAERPDRAPAARAEEDLDG